MTDQHYLSPRQIHFRWSCHEESIRRMIRNGRLPAIRFGNRRLRVAMADVEAYEASNRIKTRKEGR